MMIAWLVFTGRWDVFGTCQQDMPVGRFLGSAILAALELAAEVHWITEIVL